MPSTFYVNFQRLNTALKQQRQVWNADCIANAAPLGFTNNGMNGVANSGDGIVRHCNSRAQFRPCRKLTASCGCAAGVGRREGGMCEAKEGHALACGWGDGDGHGDGVSDAFGVS